MKQFHQLPDATTVSVINFNDVAHVAEHISVAWVQQSSNNLPIHVLITHFDLLFNLHLAAIRLGFFFLVYLLIF